MKILHTADWHMSSRLGQRDLGPYIIAAMEKIAVYLEEHEVDVMIVAGDVFCERLRDEDMRLAVAEIRRIFSPFVARGGTILAISGNHDSEVRFETVRDALSLTAPGEGGGRFLMTASPHYVTVTGRDDTKVQFVLMPYPTPRAYLRGQNIQYGSIEEKNRLVQEQFFKLLENIRTQRVKPDLPAVLVSHIHVRGAQGHSLYKITESDDVVFEPSQVPTEWAYVAYGHIHKPGEALQGAPHVRYCGSLVPMDWAEAHDIKSCVLLEIGPEGRRGEPQLLPLPELTLHQCVIDAEDDMDALAEEFNDKIAPLVSYTLRYRPETHHLPGLIERLDKIFPNWYARKFERVEQILEPEAYPEAQLENETDDGPRRAYATDVAGTVRTYVARCLQEHAEREAILDLAEQLLADESWKSA